MSFAVESQIFDKFRGIREFNGVNSGGAISALECENVELVQSEIGDATSIKTMHGNTTAYTLPSGYKVIEIFKSFQEGLNYTIIYAENALEGKLFYIEPISDTLTAIAGGFTVTGKANGITMTSTAYDVFVFTNGAEVKTLCFTSDSGYATVIANHNPVTISGVGYMATISATDYLGRSIKWLAMEEWNGQLVVCSQYGVHASHKNDVYTWNDNPTDTADSWYIDFGRETTALTSFTGGLYIFTKDDVTFLSSTPNDSNSVMQTVAMNGCFSYQSIVKHDTYLFFYDDNQKNIYYMQITDTGQTRPAGPVAKEIQSQFSHVERFKMYSCVYNTRNEIWCLINDGVLIYDYAQQEWTTRNEQNINTLAIINNEIYSGGNDGKIFIENVNSNFDGVFKPALYKTTYINIGSNTNIKKQKTPLLLTLNATYINDFWVQLICNSKEKSPKHIILSNAQGGVYAADDVVNPPPNQCYDSAVFVPESVYNKSVVEISTPQTWYTLGVKIYTQSAGEGFFIQSMELKNVKAKSKTKGR